MTVAFLEEGWVKVPYDGPELGVVEIGMGEENPSEWKPAFLDTAGGVRYAQVRPGTLAAGAAPRVWIRLNGAETLIGRLGEIGAEQRSRPRR